MAGHGMSGTKEPCSPAGMTWHGMLDNNSDTPFAHAAGKEKFAAFLEADQEAISCLSEQMPSQGLLAHLL